MSKTDIEEFIESPLLKWFKSCLSDQEKLTDYGDLTDGSLVYEVLLLIDPEPVHHGVAPTLGNPTLRTKNFECIIKNIKSLYEEELCQLIVVLPDSSRLGREPESKDGLEEMKLLLLLLLGCAVQCPNKQNFIERIKELPLDSQHSLVNSIKKVTESQEIVLTQDGESAPNHVLINHIKLLARVRDSLMISTSTSSLVPASSSTCNVGAESQHLAVELADWKSKLRKLRQEIEEKSEALSESKEEAEYNKSIVSKLKNEINELKTEVRVGKAYRDEADALREKAERAERLEDEVCKYREKLTDLDYYRSRVEELRQDKRVLEETREMLEEQLSRARSRVEYTHELEGRILNHKQTINELSLERDATQERLQRLFEENAQLSLLSKSNLKRESSPSELELDDDPNNGGGGDSSLCEQLTSDAQGRALRLELENKRLAQTLESLQEANTLQTNERLLQLEKEKKKLSLQIEELEETKKKLIKNSSELESTVKLAQRDTKRMQDLRDSLQSQLQLRIEEVETVQREKSRAEMRASEAEESLERLKSKESKEDETLELKTKIGNCEREISRLKEAIESRSVSIDRLQCELDQCYKEKLQQTRALEDANSNITRLNEIERSWKDLKGRSEVDRATLLTLEGDLIAEKLVTRKLRQEIEESSQCRQDKSYIDKILSDAEMLRSLKEKLSERGEEESTGLKEENARLSVSLSAAQSQIQSLAAQQTAQKLANSQLVAEKEEICKEFDSFKEQHQQLLVDQLNLQSIHERLADEYDNLTSWKETNRNEVKALRTALRTAKDEAESIKSKSASDAKEIERLNNEAKSLNNLRAEHSKLKEDFRNLFTASDKMKSEYRSAQDEYKSMKSEVRGLILAEAQLRGELSAKIELYMTLEARYSHLASENACLRQVKLTLEEDRKSLMDHVSTLLNQYHELLVHSLEDKDHFHMEEKLFRDKVNSICRQKEKLEEKIMDQIINSRASNKKKSFGANFVRRVRKAGTELINKSRRSWHEDPSKRGGQSGGGGGGGTDSDTSLDEVRTRQESLSGLGSVGTRRTVYLSGDEASTNNEQEEKSYSNINEPPRTSTPQHEQSVLVYNRVTAVIRDDSPPLTASTPPASTVSTRRLDNRNERWHEYGSI